MTSRSLTRAAAGMAVVTAVSRAFGFARVLVVAAVLGTTYLGNTFQAANSVSNVLFELLAAGALSAVLVPTFVASFARGDDGEARRLAGGLLGVALAGLGVVTVAGVAGAPLLARLITAGVADPEVAADQRRLTTFLLWFFVPQVLLYAYGTIATGWLYARRRFAVTAAAPIGNTIVVVAALAWFRALAGADPSFDLSATERGLLALAGTGGVAAFVGVLVIAAHRHGFPVRPRWMPRDPALGRLLRLAGWGVLLHANAGLLLGAAIVVGNSVAGGVVAYQVAFVFFLAPYAVLAQPIHTAVLPQLAADAVGGDVRAFADAVRWSLDRMALLVVPVSAAMVALALPAMHVVAFGQVRGAGAELLASGVASLAVGLFPYGAFLLLARAYYALDDSRTPALVAIVTACAGVAAMVVVAGLTSGSARVAALGLGHSVAYALGAVVLAAGLARRVRQPVMPRRLPGAAVVSAVLALGAWLATRAVDPAGRAATAGWLVALGVAGAGAYVGAIRRSWRAHAPMGAGA